jgi:hypothetical protein
MDAVQKDIRSQVAAEHERIVELEQSMARNVETMRANVEKLTARLEALGKP